MRHEEQHLFSHLIKAEGENKCDDRTRHSKLQGYMRELPSNRTAQVHEHMDKVITPYHIK